MKELITVRKRSCGKVMFLQACVKDSVCEGGGRVSQHAPGKTPSPPGQTPRGRHPLDRHPRADTSPGQTPPCPVHAGIPPPSADGHCSGRYASYWNAFLLNMKEDLCQAKKGKN